MEESLSDFRRRLEDHLPTLSKSQRRIASYLLSSYDQAAFLTAADLEQRVEVSQATIVRFAKAVGYSGFPELRRSLQDIFRASATPAYRLQSKLENLSASGESVLWQVLEMERQYLAEAAHSIDQADFDAALSILLAGQRIFVFGSGPSAVLANLAELRLRRLGVLTIALTESGRHLLEKLQLLAAGDAVLVTGFHYVRPELLAVLRHARRLGCRSVLLTDTLGPALRGETDVILAARRGPVSTFHSLTVPMAILNALILAVAMARPEQSLAALNRLQELRATSGLDQPVATSGRYPPMEAS